MTMVPGTTFILITTILATVLIVGMSQKAKTREKAPKIRRMAGLDAIEEAVGRATEMGRPIHYTPGYGDITDTNAPQTFSGLEILSYTTGLSAKYNAELVVTVRAPNVFPVAQEVVRQGYLAAGKPDMFKEDTVRFLSDAQLAWAAGVMGIIHRQKVAANLMLGFFFAESLLFAEAGAQVGAIQVAGTANMAQIAFFVAACDYTLIGEELYAGGAYLSQNRVTLGSIVGQDYVKMATMLIIALGTVMTTMNSNWLFDLMKR